MRTKLSEPPVYDSLDMMGRESYGTSHPLENRTRAHENSSLSIRRESNTRISGFMSRIGERFACHDQFDVRVQDLCGRVLPVTLRVLSPHVTRDILLELHTVLNSISKLIQSDRHLIAF